MNILELTVLSYPNANGATKPTLKAIAYTGLTIDNLPASVPVTANVYGTQVTTGHSVGSQVYIVSETLQQIQAQVDPTTANLFVSPLLVKTGLTASVTQTQVGGLALTGYINVVSTVATTGDAVTLPVGATGGQTTVIVINNGANTMQIFPPTGAAIDGGTVNASVTLIAGSKKHFYYTPVAAAVSTVISTVLPLAY